MASQIELLELIKQNMPPQGSTPLDQTAYAKKICTAVEQFIREQLPEKKDIDFTKPGIDEYIEIMWGDGYNQCLQEVKRRLGLE